MAAARSLFLLLTVAALAKIALATDPESINDFCVADLNSTLVFNGLACKRVADVVDADFKFVLTPGTPAGRLDFAISAGFAAQWPALNGLGISILRLDFGKGGLVPPHHHPRASEIFYVAEGSVLCGFVSTANVLYQQVVNSGEVFVFPKALVHFQQNVGKGAAYGISSLNSQNPGVLLEANALFGATPQPISAKTLAQTLGISTSKVTTLEKAFAA